MSNDWNSVLIPMIRKAMPEIIAQEIVDVQPIMAPVKTYTINKQESLIQPSWLHIVEMTDWAKQYPNMYTVYNVGYITYHDQAALDWFKLRWES